MTDPTPNNIPRITRRRTHIHAYNADWSIDYHYWNDDVTTWTEDFIEMTPSGETTAFGTISGDSDWWQTFLSTEAYQYLMDETNLHARENGGHNE